MEIPAAATSTLAGRFSCIRLLVSSCTVTIQSKVHDKFIASCISISVLINAMHEDYVSNARGHDAQATGKCMYYMIEGLTMQRI